FELAAPSDLLWLPNEIGPAILLAACLWGAYRIMESSRWGLWTPTPWFLAACAVYFGFGPLVYHFGSVESVRYNDTFFPVDDPTLLRTNLLNAVGVGIVLVGFLVGRTFLVREQALRIKQFNFVETRRLMLIF